ncbi:MAG: hypothetical protein ACREPQ_14450 [Rhodanobacter sp.]
MFNQAVASLTSRIVNPRLLRVAKDRVRLVDINRGSRLLLPSDAGFIEVSEDQVTEVYARLAGSTNLVVDAPELPVPMRVAMGARGDGVYGYFRAALYGEGFERTFFHFAAAPTYAGASDLWAALFNEVSPIPVNSHRSLTVSPPWIAYRVLDVRPEDSANTEIIRVARSLAVGLAREHIASL